VRSTGPLCTEDGGPTHGGHRSYLYFLIDRQSSEVDQEKRKQLVWQIERKLAEDDARPIISYSRMGRVGSRMLKA